MDMSSSSAMSSDIVDGGGDADAAADSDDVYSTESDDDVYSTESETASKNKEINEPIDQPVKADDDDNDDDTSDDTNDNDDELKEVTQSSSTTPPSNLEKSTSTSTSHNESDVDDTSDDDDDSDESRVTTANLLSPRAASAPITKGSTTTKVQPVKRCVNWRYIILLLMCVIRFVVTAVILVFNILIPMVDQHLLLLAA